MDISSVRSIEDLDRFLDSQPMQPVAKPSEHAAYTWGRLRPTWATGPLPTPPLLSLVKHGSRTGRAEGARDRSRSLYGLPGHVYPSRHQRFDTSDAARRSSALAKGVCNPHAAPDTYATLMALNTHP